MLTIKAGGGATIQGCRRAWSAGVLERRWEEVDVEVVVDESSAAERPEADCMGLDVEACAVEKERECV